MRNPASILLALTALTGLSTGEASATSAAKHIHKHVQNSVKSFAGMANYYADRFHGRPTASGRPYDKTKFTAAHRSLPFGTKLKVTNKRNGKSCIVEVTDRGPFHKSRVVDLSKAAAQKLGFVSHGHADVECRIVTPDMPEEQEIAHSIEKASPNTNIVEAAHGQAPVQLQEKTQGQEPALVGKEQLAGKNANAVL